MKNLLFFFLLSIFLTGSKAIAVKNPVCDVVYEDNEGDRFARRRRTYLRRIERDKAYIAQPESSTKMMDISCFLFCSFSVKKQDFIHIRYEILRERVNKKEGANIIGRIDLQVDPSSNVIRIQDIIVDERDRKRRYATNALRVLFRDLSQRDIAQYNPTIVLDVADSNVEALGLYRKFGFIPKRENLVGNVHRMSVALGSVRLPIDY